MLIRRTIDKPEKKISLLINFMVSNNMRWEVKNRKDGLVETNDFYISEAQLARILKISRATIRRWRQKELIHPRHLNLDARYEFSREVYRMDLNEYNKLKGTIKPDRFHYNLMELFHSLRSELYKKQFRDELY
jgi:hypothetical protein